MLLICKATSSYPTLWSLKTSRLPHGLSTLLLFRTHPDYLVVFQLYFLFGPIEITSWSHNFSIYFNLVQTGSWLFSSSATPTSYRLSGGFSNLLTRRPPRDCLVVFQLYFYIDVLQDSLWVFNSPSTTISYRQSGGRSALTLASTSYTLSLGHTTLLPTRPDPDNLVAFHLFFYIDIVQISLWSFKPSISIFTQITSWTFESSSTSTSYSLYTDYLSVYNSSSISTPYRLSCGRTNLLILRLHTNYFLDFQILFYFDLIHGI